MALTQAQLLEWLRSPDGKNRTVLVEINHSAGIERFSNTGYRDSSGNQYLDRVIGQAQFSFSAAGARFIGFGDSSWSNIQLKNIFGDLDYLTDLNAPGYAVSVFVGDRTWDKTDFYQVMSALFDSITAPSQGVIDIQVRNLNHFLDGHIQKNFFQSGDLNPGLPHPIAYGPCFNISPVLVQAGVANYPGGKWMCNSGEQGAIDSGLGTKMVFDEGQPLTKYTGALPVPPGNWKPYLEANTSPNVDWATGFYLGSPPAGLVTADYVGATVVPGDKNARSVIATILERLVPTSFGSNIVTPSQSTSPSTADVNFYTRELITGKELIERLLQSVSAFGYFDGAGDFNLGVIQLPKQDTDFPYTPPEIEVTKDDIILGSLSLDGFTVPYTEMRFNYFKNWTTQDQKGSLPAGFEARTSRLSQEWLQVLQLGASSSTYKYAIPAPLLDLLVHGHDHTHDDNNQGSWGNDLTGVLFHFWHREKVPLMLFSFTLKGVGLLIKPGTPFRLTFPRFGFENGRNVVCLSQSGGFGEKTSIEIKFLAESNFSSGYSSKTIFGFPPLQGDTAQGSSGQQSPVSMVITSPPPPSVQNESVPGEVPHEPDPFVTINPNHFIQGDSQTAHWVDIVNLTSLTNTGETALSWILTQEDTPISVTGTEFVTVGAETKELPYREFTGTNSWIQNSGSPIIDHFNFSPTPFRVDAIFKVTGGTGQRKLFGNEISPWPTPPISSNGLQARLYQHNTNPGELIEVSAEYFNSNDGNFKWEPAGNYVWNPPNTPAPINTVFAYAMIFDPSGGGKFICACRPASMGLIPEDYTTLPAQYFQEIAFSGSTQHFFTPQNFAIGHGTYSQMTTTGAFGFIGRVYEFRIKKL